MNNVNLLGRLTKDIEVKFSANNLAMASFTLAVNKYVKAGEEKQADFILCKAFGKTAEAMGKFLEKGRQIAVTGRINTGSYEKEGQKIYTTDIIVDSFYFADSKKGDDNSTTATSSYTKEPEVLPIDDGADDLPF